MLISSTLRPASGKVASAKTTAAKPEVSEQPKDSYVRSFGNKALGLIKKTAKAAKPYAKSALITAAPAMLAAVAAGIGGAPLAGAAILASGAVGAIAGAAVWGKDIGLIRGFAGGGIAGMFSAGSGALGGAYGVVNMAAIGATREALLRHLADVPTTS